MKVLQRENSNQDLSLSSGKFSEATEGLNADISNRFAPTFLLSFRNSFVMSMDAFFLLTHIFLQTKRSNHLHEIPRP